jgi:adenylate cyclase class IV
MPVNIEIKARVDDHDRIALLAREAGGSAETVIVQEDVFFRVDEGKLKLRIFDDGRGELIRYRRASGVQARPSEYAIAPTTEPSTLRRILQDVLGETSVVRKTRRLIMIGQTRVHLDHVELEVVLQDGQTEEDGRAIADELMHRLSIDASDLLSESYVDMLTPSH